MADDTRTTGQSSELEDILDSIRRIMDEEEGYERMREGRDTAEDVASSSAPAPAPEAVPTSGMSPGTSYAFDEDMNEAEDLDWIASNHEAAADDLLAVRASAPEVSSESQGSEGRSDYSDFRDDNSFSDVADFNEEFLERNTARASSDVTVDAAKLAGSEPVISMSGPAPEGVEELALESPGPAPDTALHDDMDVLDRVARSMFGSDDEGVEEGANILPDAPDLEAFGTDYKRDGASAEDEDYSDFNVADTAARDFEQFVQPAADLSGIESQFDSVADYAFDQGEAIEEELLELTNRLEGQAVAEHQEPYLHHHFGPETTTPVEPVRGAAPAFPSAPVEEIADVEEETVHDETAEYAAKVLERAAGGETSHYASARDDEALISEATERATARAMAALTEDGGEGLRMIHSGIRISASDDTMTVEALVREMLRPMLKEWLNDNLPSIVDHQVRREVERIGSNAHRYLVHDDEAG